MKRGDIYYVDLGKGVGSEQGGVRPCLIVQNDIGNKYSTTTIVACITTKLSKHDLPTHVKVMGFGLERPSMIIFEQLRTIDKSRIGKYIGFIPESKWSDALKISIGV